MTCELTGVSSCVWDSTPRSVYLPHAHVTALLRRHLVLDQHAREASLRVAANLHRRSVSKAQSREAR